MNLALLMLLVILYMPQKTKERKEVNDVCAKDKMNSENDTQKEGSK